MASSLIRGKYVVCRVSNRSNAEVLEDGAVFQRDGVIVEIGKHKDLSRKYVGCETLGSDQHVVLPGFVNSHHHVGLTPFQLGSPDLPLELWFASRLCLRNVDLYLDTLYSAFEMIESGITTVQHLHARVNGPVERIHQAANTVIKAYKDIGMRVSYSFALRDQNRLVYEADEEFIKRLPAELSRGVGELLHRQVIPLEDHFALFEQLYGEHKHAERIRIQLAPHNLHSCSDRALAMVREYAEKYRVPVHMHLVETKYQREYSRRRTGTTAVSHLRNLGLLGPLMTLGHGVWLTQADIDAIAERGAQICHNVSSNLRLRSGIAPLNSFERRGIHVAIGLDEAGINDNRDMLQEMRLVLRSHRIPGMEDDDVPTSAQVLRMATEYGATTTPFGTRIGTLEAGKAADLSFVSWKHMAHPYLSSDVSVVDAVVHRARSAGVETVLVAGEPILRDRKFTRVNKEEILEELATSLRVPLDVDEALRGKFCARLITYVKRFYQDEGYLNEPACAPFYQFNCTD